MAHYVTSLSIPRRVEDAFAFVSDFRNAGEWDPATRQAYKVTDGPVGLGTRFVIVASVLGLPQVLPYEIVTYEPPHELVLVGETERLIYRDRLIFTAEGQATRLDYDAKLDFKGVFAVGDALLQVLFQRIGDAATRGIPDAVAAASPAPPPPRPRPE